MVTSDGEEAEPYEGGDPSFGEIAVTVQGRLLHESLISSIFYLALVEFCPPAGRQGIFPSAFHLQKEASLQLGTQTENQTILDPFLTSQSSLRGVGLEHSVNANSGFF